MKITLSLIKADVGSVGGHTEPTPKMIKAAKQAVDQAIKNGLIIDGLVTHTGDDIALLMSHTKGADNPEIHNFARETLLKSADQAHKCGCYGAGQDLLANAPSSNVRGAGAGVAEIEFDHKLKDERSAESFMVFAADKCGLGAYNLPLYLAFGDAMYCSGLMLPKMIKGFTFNIIDMHHTDGDSIITLNAPEDSYKIAMLLRNGLRFAIQSIYSREYPNQQAVATSAMRHRKVGNKYVGKDDPVALVRNQGIFPAPEETMSPFTKAHYVDGGSRGAHNMPLMPVKINTAIAGVYALPIISALGFSLTKDGHFSDFYTDFFGNVAWDYVREKAQRKALAIREQGWSGPAMIPYEDMEYSGFKTTMDSLLKQFKIKK